jgi:hypothetical protein
MDDKACKEVNCQRVDPYRITKQSSCTLVALDMDEQYIGCLGHVMSRSTFIPTMSYVLLVMNRNDFLLGDTNETIAGSRGYSEDISKITVIDIDEVVVNYLINLDDPDDRVLELVAFLNGGGAIGKVSIEPSWSIAACGHGQFMLDIEIAIPNQYMVRRTIDRKLFLFSSSIGTIVWSYQNKPLLFSAHRRDMSMACLRRPVSDCHPIPTSFAVAGGRPDEILIGEMEPGNTVQYVKSLTLIKYYYNDIQYRSVWSQGNTFMILSPTHLVIAANRHQRVGSYREVALTICDKNEFMDQSFVETDGRCNSNALLLKGSLEVHSLSLIRNNYIALVCSISRYKTVQLFVVVVHIPSRLEIFRMERRYHQVGSNVISRY